MDHFVFKVTIALEVCVDVKLESFDGSPIDVFEEINDDWGAESLEDVVAHPATIKLKATR